jgi:integration host factor subunit alpha
MKTIYIFLLARLLLVLQRKSPFLTWHENHEVITCPVTHLQEAEIKFYPLTGRSYDPDKNEIISQINDLGFPKKESAELFKTLLEIIKSSLENGEDVLVSGFGKFQTKDKAPRRGRNPATNDDMVLDARRVVSFKCSGKLKRRLNKAE